MKKIIISGLLVSSLAITSLAGVVYAKVQPKAIVEIIGISAIGTNYDTIILPAATGMYFTEFPEMKYILDENGMNTYHPNALEYSEKTNAKWGEINTTTNAPREILGYIREDGKSTILEIAGYYTDDLGNQVEYRDEMIFDFIFDQGYDYYSSRNMDFAPDVIEIPSNFDDIPQIFINPNASDEELERNAQADKVVYEFSSYDWVESVVYSFLGDNSDFLFVIVEQKDKNAVTPMTEEELSEIATELAGCQVQVTFD